MHARGNQIVFDHWIPPFRKTHSSPINRHHNALTGITNTMPSIAVAMQYCSTAPRSSCASALPNTIGGDWYGRTVVA